MDIGRVIRRRRVALGLTQDEVEKATGLDQGYLSRVENGKVRRPNGMYLVLIARALDCTVEDLMREAAEAAQRRPVLCGAYA